MFEEVDIPLSIPDSAAAGPGALEVSAWYAGAAGNAASCTQSVLDPTTGTLAALISADVRDGAVHLAWAVPDAGPWRIERRDELGAWSTRGARSADGTHRVAFVDPGVSPGVRYGYRLVAADGSARATSEAWVTIPSRTTWALRGARPNPAFTGAQLDLTLPAAGVVTLEVFDVTGRRQAAVRSLQLAAGAHRVPFPRHGLGAGLYLVRATFGGRTQECRIVFLD